MILFWVYLVQNVLSGLKGLLSINWVKKIIVLCFEFWGMWLPIFKIQQLIIDHDVP